MTHAQKVEKFKALMGQGYSVKQALKMAGL